MNLYMCVCVCVCARCMKFSVCNTTFFGCQPSSSNPICVVIERENKRKKGKGGDNRERDCASGSSLLSSSGRAGTAQSG